MTDACRSAFARAVLALSLLVAAPRPLTAQGGTGASWTLSGTGASEFEVSTDSNGAHGGRASARLRALVAEPTGFATITQSIRDASPYRGKRLRFGSWIRTQAKQPSGAYLYAAATMPAGGPPPDAYANSINRAVRGTTGWRYDTVTITVPSNAVGINVGLIVEGAGEAWIDDASLELLDAGGLVSPLSDAGFEQPVVRLTPFAFNSATTARAATPREIDGLMALARLAGYVRFFHPSDSVLHTDWQRFLVRAMRELRADAPAEQLARSLGALFADVAPTVQIYPTGTPPAPRSVAPGTRDSLGIARWLHRGVGLPTSTAPPGQSVYWSARIITPWTGVVPELAMHPDSARVVDLGAGVSARIPMSLILPLPSDTTKRWVNAPRTSGAVLSLNDRAVRLAAAAELWMVMKHFYPYWNVARTDWDAELRRTLASAAVAPRPSVFDSAMTRMVAALRDGHGNLYRAGRASLQYGVVFDVVEGQLVVTHVSDSARRDVRRGDIVEQVDGKPARVALAERSERVSTATPQWAEYRALYELAVSPDTVRRLTLRDPSGARPPGIVTLRGVGPRSRDDIPAEPRPPKIADLRPGVLYVDMGRISDAEFIAALPRLYQATSIVFDLRGYPSFNTVNLLRRLTDSTIRSAHFRIPYQITPGAVSYPQDGAWTLTPISPRITARAYFLTDGRAISYAESTMGVVEHYKLGEIIGAPTAGTNGNINPFTLPGGYTVIWTGMLVEKRDGTPHHGVGIKPTVPVSRTLQGVREGRDEFLEKALELIRERAPRG